MSLARLLSLDGSCVCLKKHFCSTQESVYLLSYPQFGFDPVTDFLATRDLSVLSYPICSCKLGRSYTALLAIGFGIPVYIQYLKVTPQVKLLCSKRFSPEFGRNIRPTIDFGSGAQCETDSNFEGVDFKNYD